MSVSRVLSVVLEFTVDKRRVIVLLCILALSSSLFVFVFYFLVCIFLLLKCIFRKCQPFFPQYSQALVTCTLWCTLDILFIRRHFSQNTRKRKGEKKPVTPLARLMGHEYDKYICLLEPCSLPFAIQRQKGGGGCDSVES